jgi:site-specific DNA recombinase
LVIELAGVRRDPSLPSVEDIKASQVDLFGKVLRQRLFASDSLLAKSYLNLLLDEIVVQDKRATIRGSYDAFADTLQK